jgi:hypothetical protein
MVSGVSPAAGDEAASLIEKETIERLTSNIELRYSIFCGSLVKNLKLHKGNYQICIPDH